MRIALHSKRRFHPHARGTTYVELLVIIGIVLTLGLAAVTMIRNSSKAKAQSQASCIKSGKCGVGASGGAGGGGVSGGSGGAGSPGGVSAPSSGGGVLSAIGDFGYGFGAEAWGMVTGTYEAVRHPIQTAQGLAFVATHPGETLAAIKAEWAGRSTAENLGRGALEIVSFIGPGAIAKIGKAAEIAGDAGKVAEVARTAEAAAAAEKAIAAEKAAAEAAAAEKAAAEAKNAACPGGICEVAGNCFAAGTPVLTPSGEKSIENVVVGDVVMARDPETGETRQEHVSQLFITPDREVVDLELTPDAPSAHSEHLTVTPEHPFYATGRGFLPVRELELGMHVTTAGGTATVSSLTALSTKITVYNFEVEDAHTYFVGHLAAWVHNVCAAAFEKSISKMAPGDRVALVRQAVGDYAKQNGWVKDSKLSKINGRDVYRDPASGKLYSADTQHGRIETANAKGKHQGEMNLEGEATKPADKSGGHDLIMP